MAASSADCQVESRHGGATQTKLSVLNSNLANGDALRLLLVEPFSLVIAHVHTTTAVLRAHIQPGCVCTGRKQQAVGVQSVRTVSWTETREHYLCTVQQTQRCPLFRPQTTQIMDKILSRGRPRLGRLSLRIWVCCGSCVSSGCVPPSLLSRT